MSDTAPGRLAAITDEFSTDLEVALAAMHHLGFGGVELRLVDGKNVIDLTDAEAARARDAVERRGMRVVSIASPILKYVLPEGPPVDERLQQDVFGAAYRLDDHPRLARRVLEVAGRLGARIIRVFSFWRTVEPRRCFPAIADTLRPLADAAGQRGLAIGLENEFACNVGTADEAAELLDRIEHPALGLIWDPANMAVLGGVPFPDGYSALPIDRLLHVHVKDCTVDNFVPTWQPPGRGSIDWDGQIGALVRDGYAGAFSLETHWRGEKGDRLEASQICGAILKEMLSGALDQTAAGNPTLSPVRHDR